MVQVYHNHPLISNLNSNPLIPIYIFFTIFDLLYSPRDIKGFHKTFNVLLFKNENYQQLIIKKEHYLMTNMNVIIFSVLQRKALERQYM